MIRKTPYPKSKPVAVWLLTCCALVFAMAVIGALTRLTGSGLSMVEWRPLMGALPPMNPQEWERVFALYQESPEFEKINADMDLAGFKQIFYWEWFHRLLGRLIGIVYALPFFWFLIRRQLPKLYMPDFFMFLLLGGAQGLMGWYMVQSGLIDNPAVSHYRLAAHLGLALLIFALMFYRAITLLYERDDGSYQLAPLTWHTNIALISLTLTMVWGAFVAGLDAGLIYNTFPMMGDMPWPAEIFDMKPLWINLVENHATVQFIHRVLATITILIVLSIILRSRGFNKPPRCRFILNALLGTVFAQYGLGILTLVSNVFLPLAALHQAGAIILLALLIALRHELPATNFSASS